MRPEKWWHVILTMALFMALSPLSAQAGPFRSFAPLLNRQAFTAPQPRGNAFGWNGQNRQFQQPNGNAYGQNRQWQQNNGNAFGWNGQNRQWRQTNGNAYGWNGQNRQFQQPNGNAYGQNRQWQQNNGNAYGWNGQNRQWDQRRDYRRDDRWRQWDQRRDYGRDDRWRQWDHHRNDYGRNDHRPWWDQQRNGYGENNRQYQGGRLGNGQFQPPNGGQQYNPGTYNHAGYQVQGQSPNNAPSASGYSHNTTNTTLPAGQTGTQTGFSPTGATGNTPQPQAASAAGAI
ncbi:MAG: hypothetical protein WBW55_11810 [Desulfobaccales bacterium]